MSATSRQYQGESAESRIGSRRQQLMEQALSAVIADEWNSMSISELCRRAELHKRYFYESFETLDDIIAALIEEASSRIVTIAFEEARAASQAGCTPGEMSERVIGGMMDFLTEDPRRARVLFTDAADSPATRQKRKDMVTGFIDALSAYARYHYKLKNTESPRERLYVNVLVGGTISSFLSWLAGEIPMTKKQFTEYLASLWLNTGDFAASHPKTARK